MARASPPSWVCRLPPTTMAALACVPSPPCWLAISPSPSTMHVPGRMSPSTFWTAYVGRQGEPKMQRLEATRERIERFLHRLGQVFRGNGRLYLVGGSLMVFQGYRPVTQDLDYTVHLVAGDDQDFTSAVRQVQREINLNIERASPGDF